LKETVLSEDRVDVYSPNQVFACPEESQFYSQCLEKMLLNQKTEAKSVVEFGSGDGSPVISCLLKTPYQGSIQGFELSLKACTMAQYHIQMFRLSNKYTIHNTCFFKNFPSHATCLIANPPYIPAPDSNIYMPSLHGGSDGAAITKRLLSVGCDNALLMISAYSNPVETIEYAQAEGYQVNDFMISPLQFGYYSSEPKVRNRIAELRKVGKAFYSQNIYFLAGVMFGRRNRAKADLSNELIKVMTSL